ncbi:hypothetical protein PFISCL1PPCAC_4794, partial [Pristionchus fissidentatus]
GWNEYWITTDNLSDFEKKDQLTCSIRKLVRTEQIWQRGIIKFRDYLKNSNMTWNEFTKYRPKEDHSWWDESYEIIPGDGWKQSQLAEYKLQ